MVGRLVSIFKKLPDPFFLLFFRLLFFFLKKCFVNSLKLFINAVHELIPFLYAHLLAAYPNLDLKLGNPTDCQMFIECKEVGYTLYCSIWGAKPEGYDEIRTHNELGDTGEKSYSVRAWRIYYKDGKEIDREELPKSSYDNDYGVVFSEADNDSQAVDTNVDEAGGNTSSGSGSNSAGSGDSDNNSQDAQTYYYYVEEQYDDSSEENEAFDYQE